MHRFRRLWLLAVLMTLGFTAVADAGLRGFFVPKGPGTRYRYPLFREGNRPEHVRRNAGDAYRRYSPYQWYPKYYGGLHTRETPFIGTPPGDRGLRGTAW